MIVSKEDLIKLLKDFAKGLSGIDCKKYDAEIRIVGLNDEFAKQAPHLKALVKELENKHA